MLTSQLIDKNQKVRICSNFLLYAPSGLVLPVIQIEDLLKHVSVYLMQPVYLLARNQKYTALKCFHLVSWTQVQHASGFGLWESCIPLFRYSLCHQQHLLPEQRWALGCKYGALHDMTTKLFSGRET